MKSVYQVSLFSLSLLFIAYIPSLAQQTPEQRYFEWTSLPFPKEEYAQRREKMLRLQQEKKTIYLCPSRDGLSDGESYRQLDDFNYFTGLELPNSMLVIDGASDEITLFTPDRDFRFESASRKNDFPGRPLRDDPELKIRSGLSSMRSIDELKNYLEGKTKQNVALSVNIGSPTPITKLQTDFITSWSPEVSLVYHLQRTFPSAKLENAYHDVGKLRIIKSEHEIEALRKAVDITVKGIEVAVKRIKPGVDERTLEGEMEGEFKRQGSPRIAFASIIKSGPNSMWPWRILAAHYERRNRAMQDGELVIFDVGCEYNNYVSDMGRTFPVSG
ncbi:MAG: Xaa-Pro peptidase family protein, partial [Cyclobacteriaceae bacterium]